MKIPEFKYIEGGAYGARIVPSGEATEAANNLVGFFDLLYKIDRRNRSRLKKSNLKNSELRGRVK